MRTIELPGGHQATLRDDTEMLGRGKRVMRAAMMGAAGLYQKLPSLQEGAMLSEGLTPDEQAAAAEQMMAKVSDEIRAARLTASDFEALEGLREAAVVALFESWTLPLPRPTMETIGTLDGATYDALLAGVGALPTAALSGFGETADPESPTNDSGSSSTSSTEDGPGSSPTQISSTDGTPTAGASSSPAQ